MGAEFLFMDDNTRPHRANIVDECLQSEDITRMDWPAYSLDLNPVEHVWDMLGQRIAAREPPPTCLPELRRALLDEWYNPQDQIDNLILSMPRRCPRNSSGKGLDVRLLLAVTLSTVLDDLAWFHPGFEVVKSISPTSSNLTGGFAARRLVRVPTCHRGITRLQTSMPSSGFEFRPNGTAVSVPNHYTE
ncbi:transposable element Tc3 transposase [Trichonephila clavipes]|uniref:Transposable element Tc3 transposase n=1 Tax=Trichonephila clavipes TaxID=2585209 RepID=A0A8X6RXI8_TRICX|nr:transposable element Tc3 transposase [Trichonephila clavipes]